ncbi:DUF1405 domain-containing protein [Caldalkalibacillus mannanilyticus]|uniref:DUF1405 domain-containing protein n=1 Tax=Caldalkalibacillus mannanilyticus TaxID=1418 RepID=UPI0004683775|nr:DUF1405 domain-containing protein [Caldalkalibacillus mannanilyticus]
MFLWSYFISWLGKRSTLWLVLMINFLGTIYGYYWYKEQLLQTSWWLWPFVPDSPTASLFFCFVLIALLLHKKWPLVEAYAAVTLFKYGIWATIMILWTNQLGGKLQWEHYMLMTSHVAMAVQALLYNRYYSFKLKHVAIVALLTITNDLYDYTLGIYPTLDWRLESYLSTVYLFTFSLSILSVFLFSLLVKLRLEEKNKILS